MAIAPIAFIGNLGWFEYMIIGVIAVLLFGKRLPEVGRWLGQTLVEFKKGASQVKDEFNKAVDDTETSPSDSGTPAKSLDEPDDAYTQSQSSPSTESAPATKAPAAEALTEPTSS